MTMQAAALEYSRRGWVVWPIWGIEPNGKCRCRQASCTQPGKHPAVNWGEVGRVDEAQIRAWWPDGATHGIGVSTGPKSGIWVLDIDPRHDGDQTLRNIVRRNGELPDTLMSLTGGGGEHYFFAYPPLEDDKVIRNRVGLAEGIDVRGEGGYIVLPPSPHASGRGYRWEVTTEDTPPAPAPDWLLEAVLRSRRPHAAPLISAVTATASSRYGLAALSAECRAAAEARPGTRNDALFRAACKAGALVAGGELVEREAFDALMQAGLAAADKGTEAKVKATVERGLQTGASSPRKAPVSGQRPPLPPELRGEAPPGPDDAEDRPTVHYTQNNLMALIRIAERLTYQFDWPIYARAGGMVSLIRTPGVPPRLAPMTVNRLRAIVDRSIRWVTERRFRGKKFDQQVNAPLEVVQGLLERGQWEYFPVVDCIVETPTIRPDGTIVPENTYDEELRVLTVCSESFPAVPERPTQKQALEALGRVAELFAEFQFSEMCDLASAVAALLTVVVRPAMATAPMFAVGSHTPGSGKSLIAEVIALVATGRPANHQSHIEDENEFNKILTAVAIEATPLMSIDNVKNRLQSPSLDKVVTSGFHTGRLLNRNEMVSLPLRATIIVTGNNLQYGGDLARRTISITLDPQSENPEQGRKYKLNLKAYARQHRALIVRDLLTIVRAYAAAGWPEAGTPGLEGATPLGSFEEWDRLVRRPLLWLDMADPVDTLKRLRGTDNADLELVAMAMAAWSRVFADKPQTLADVLRTIADAESESEKLLKDAFDGLSGGRARNAKSLGMTLKRYVGRIVAGRRLKRVRKDSGSVYTVETVGKTEKEAGNGEPAFV